MTTRYPTSRLPGPAVRLFDLEFGADLDPDATVRQGAHEAKTIAVSPEVEWMLTEECK
jgi:hypothetical protein